MILRLEIMAPNFENVYAPVSHQLSHVLKNEFPIRSFIFISTRNLLHTGTHVSHAVFQNVVVAL
jgi:hypothetical protein